MGQFYNYIKYPKTAVIRERIDRVKKAEADHDRFEKSWESSSELQTIKELKEREKLARLENWDFIDGEQEIQFSKNIVQAEEEISRKLGKNQLSDTDKDTFKMTLIEEGDQTIKQRGKQTIRAKRIELEEDNADFELSDQDKKRFAKSLKTLQFLRAEIIRSV